MNQIDTIEDTDWIGRSFLIAGSLSNKELKRWRKYSAADFSYLGTGIGQNTVLNPAPGWTPLADIPRPGLLSKSKRPIITPGNIGASTIFDGIGRCYHESHVRNRQTLFCRAGTVVYKGLFTFYTSFYDNESATLARTGRTSLTYYAGLLTGIIATLPLSPFILLGRVWNYFVGRSSSNYMDFKPAQPLFWIRMQVIYNTIGASLGIVARTWDNVGHYTQGDGDFDTQGDSIDDLDNAGQQAYKEAMHRLMPDIFTKDGQLVVFEVGLGVARAEVAHRQKINELALGAGSSLELYNRLIAYMEKPDLTKPKSVGMEEYVKRYHESVMGSIALLALEFDPVGDAVTGAVNAVQSGQDPDAVNALAQRAQQSGGNPESTANQATPGEAAVDSMSANAMGFMSGGFNLNSGFRDPDVPMGSSNGPSLTAVDDVPPVGGDYPGSKLAQNMEPNGVTTINTEYLPGGEAAGGDESARLRNQTQFKTTDREVGPESGGSGGNIATRTYEKIQGWFTKYGENFELEKTQAAGFVGFEVKYTGAGSISITNAIREPDIQNTLNGISTSAFNTRVSTADYNTGFGFIDAAMQAVRGFVGGAVDGVGMSGLLALAGGGLVDIGKQWESSTASLPTASFEIELDSYYGDPLSQYINLYPTISAILALGVPQSAGPKSYTSPWWVEAYSEGCCAIRRGMLTDITITHGDGPMGYTEDRRPLTFKISFTIADASSLYYMTINNGFNPLRPTRRVLDDDNPFLDYLNVITGLSMRDQIDPKRKLSLHIASRLMDYKSFASPQHFASRLGGTDPMRAMNRMFGDIALPGV